MCCVLELSITCTLCSLRVYVNRCIIDWNRRLVLSHLFGICLQFCISYNHLLHRLIFGRVMWNAFANSLACVCFFSDAKLVDYFGHARWHYWCMFRVVYVLGIASYRWWTYDLCHCGVFVRCIVISSMCVVGVACLDLVCQCRILCSFSADHA